jgi:hypothetical protein
MEEPEHRPWRCLFCRMPTGTRLFAVPLCPICRDQVQDFVWASAIQGALVLVGVLTSFQFVLEEAFLFGVLVVIKHRLPSIFDRFVRIA